MLVKRRTLMAKMIDKDIRIFNKKKPSISGQTFKLKMAADIYEINKKYKYRKRESSAEHPVHLRTTDYSRAA